MKQLGTQSRLNTVYKAVRTTFGNLRMSGQSVDREDLLGEFVLRARNKFAKLEAKARPGNHLHEEDQLLLRTWSRRMEKHVHRGKREVYM